MSFPNEMPISASQMFDAINNLANSNIAVAQSHNNLAQQLAALNQNISDISLYAKQMGLSTKISNVLGSFFRASK